jgi:hypothetical protein
MGLCERVVPGGVGRGNVMLAAAMMLAVLVVLVALGLTLAPTGSDGITDESPDNSEFNVVESGLQQAVFVESNDTLDPAYDPEFHPPDSDGPPPIDNATVAALLAPEPFTDEQVVQIQSLLMSLGYRSMGGDIAALEPVPGETETGVLIRLGNLEPRDLGDTDTPLVENATAVRDVELLFERTTLPTAPENATTAHVGDWTLAAYQNTTTDRVHYQLGQYDPDDSWHTTGQAENLHVNVHEGTVNGAPVADGLGFDPGEPPVDVQVRDTNRSNPGGTSTHGGLNAVAVGAGSGDVDGETLSAETDWQEVVTRPVFNTTYLDATTTLDTRLAVDARYTHFEYAHDGSEPFLMDVSLAVETEEQSNLTGGSGNTLLHTSSVAAGGVSPFQGSQPPPNGWVAQYGGAEGSDKPTAYTVSATGVYMNGTETEIPVSQSNLSLMRDGEDAACEVYPKEEENTDEPEASGEPCANVYLPSVYTFAYVAPHEPMDTLTVVPDFGELPAINPPEQQDVTVLDPYTGTTLTGPDGVTVGDPVTAANHTFEMPRVRADTAPYQPELSNLTTFTPAGTTQSARLHETFDVSEGLFEDVLARLATANTTTIDNFVKAGNNINATNIIGYNGNVSVYDLLQNVTGTELTSAAFLQGDPQQALAAGLLAGDKLNVQLPTVTAVADTLAQTETIATDTETAQGPALDGLVLTLYSENTTASTSHNGIERFGDLVTTHTGLTDTTAVEQLVQDWGIYIGEVEGRVFDEQTTADDIVQITNDRDDLPLDGVTAGNIYEKLDGLTAASLAPGAVNWTNETQRSQALLLGGVTDPDAPVSDAVTDIQQAVPLTPSRATLADAATTTPLNTDAFGPGGSYELAQDWPADRLTTTWDILVTGAYEFDDELYPHAPTYTDTTTVSLGDDTIEGEIAFVGAEIDANDALVALNESGSISLSALAGQYSDFERPPLVVNDTTAVNVTVVTNAGEVYESGSLPMPPINLTVTDTGGATVTTSDGRTPTITATSRTTEPLTDPITIEVGVTKTPGEGPFETVVGTTLGVNAIGVSLRGDLSWTPPDYGQPNLDQGPINYSTSLEYTFGSAYSAGELVTRGVAPADHGAVTFLHDGVATYDSDGNQFVLDNDGSTYITIEDLSEAAALDVADELPIPSQFDAQAWLIVECPDTDDCDGDDDDDNGAGEPRQSLIGAVGEPLELASPVPSERSWAVEETPNTATGPQDVPYPVEHEDIDAYSLGGYAEPGGGNVWDTDGGPAPTITEDQTLTVYLYENFIARHYDDFVGNDSIDPNERLEQGTVSWRDDGPTHQCQDSGPPSMGCEPRPVALVDFVGTTGSTWTSSASLLEEDVSFDPTQQAGGDGGHAYDLEFEVTTQADVDPGNSTRVNVSFDAENSGLNRPYASTANLYLPVNIEETSDPDAPSPANFVVHSVLGNGTQYPEKTIPQGAYIKNVGNSSGTQPIEIINDTGDKYTEVISLASGETTTVTTDVDIGFDDIGETANYEIATKNESQTATRTVLNGGDFRVSDISWTQPSGGSVNFDITVANIAYTDGIVKLNATALAPHSSTTVDTEQIVYHRGDKTIALNVPHDGDGGDTVTFEFETQNETESRDVDIPDFGGG